MMGGMMGGSGFGGFGTFGLISGILNLVITVGVIAGIVALAIWLVRRLGQESGVPTSAKSLTVEGPSPREILQARYARGEIDRDEYQQIFSDLG